jgi:hypothetical protein
MPAPIANGKMADKRIQPLPGISIHCMSHDRLYITIAKMPQITIHRCLSMINSLFC